jgi:hypothetical protein
MSTTTNDRATIARAAREHGLSVAYAAVSAASYEQDGKSLTVSYGSEEDLVGAFYIHARAVPGRPLDSVDEVVAALDEMVPQNDVPST